MSIDACPSAAATPASSSNAPAPRGVVIIPLGGLGSRFKAKGFPQPKALVPVADKPILLYLLECLRLPPGWVLCIPYNIELRQWDFENVVRSWLAGRDTKVSFLPLETQTRGAAETLLLAVRYLEETEAALFTAAAAAGTKVPICSIDADSFYAAPPTQPGFDVFEAWGGRQNAVFSFRDVQPSPIFSYVQVVKEQEDGANHNEERGQNENYMRITEIVEKRKISDFANSGVYAFADHAKLKRYAAEVIEKDIREKNEYYTSTVIRRMLENGEDFWCRLVPNKCFFSLGTPEQVAQYQTCFLLDLDGTLVNTDATYIKVWNRLLQPYGLSVDKGFFETFIKGKSDLNFLKYLMPDVTDAVVGRFAEDKDTEFVKQLGQVADPGAAILISGVEQFLQKIKNSRIAVVTSCNRTAAEYILRITGLSDYTHLLIASEDCQQHKPHPEPYMHAMRVLHAPPESCIIIEDSSPGLLAASRACPRKVCLFAPNVQGEETSLLEEARDIEADVVFSSWEALDVDKLYSAPPVLNIDILPSESGSTSQPSSPKSTAYDQYAREIMGKLSHLPVRDVQYRVENIKTGYICDINAFRVLYTNGDEETVVFKISNFGNELSKVATQLDMYEKEGYFYEQLAVDVVSKVVAVPKTLGVVRSDNRIGIIMEDLRTYHGVWNCDLNSDVQLLLSVIGAVFKMHDTYFFEKPENVIPSMQNLVTPQQITYYQRLVKNRFETFINRNGIFMTKLNREVCIKIASHYEQIAEFLSSYPLSFVHGDLKSPNIFYRMNSKEGGARGATVGGVLGAAGGNVTPVLCDWQYIHLNKGVSDIAFLLVESIRFDPFLVDLAVHFYYQLWAQKKGSRLGGSRTSSGAGDGGVGGAGAGSTPRTAAGGSSATASTAGASPPAAAASASPGPGTGGPTTSSSGASSNGYSYEQYMMEFKLSLALFPFFVMVWFNSEDSDKLIDKSFPIRFMKNLLDYYSHFFKDTSFFDELERIRIRGGAGGSSPGAAVVSGAPGSSSGVGGQDAGKRV